MIYNPLFAVTLRVICLQHNLPQIDQDKLITTRYGSMKQPIPVNHKLVTSKMDGQYDLNPLFQLEANRSKANYEYYGNSSYRTDRTAKERVVVVVMNVVSIQVRRFNLMNIIIISVIIIIIVITSISNASTAFDLPVKCLLILLYYNG